MRIYPSTLPTLFPPKVETPRTKARYSLLTPLLLFCTSALVYLGLVASLQFLWPGLSRGAIEISAMIIFSGWVVVARKVGVIPIFTQAEADEMPRGWYFLSCFLGFSILWVVLSSAHANRIALGSVLEAAFMGLFWAAVMTGFSRHRF